ncbi:MAG: HEAT repeat domain-containing protein [Deltaproteobacteria bacterium]|nr:HEAT repeat domain-containing protein [Candidatus Anaeroferrophillacea bacterium]
MPFVKPHTPVAPEHDERARPRDLAGLRAILNAPDPMARRWAARDLASHPEAVTDLIARLEVESDPAVREALLTSLTEIGDAAAVAGLVRCLRSQEAALRNEAIEAMKNLPEAVAPVMTDLLRDPDPDVRILAVNVLESLRHPEVENWLIAVVRDDAHVNVCAAAVDLLGEVGSTAALEPLEALKRRFPDEPYIAFAADLALKRVREA